MTNSNVPRQRQKPRNPLTLAGKPRNQEAERKRLVREVQRLESDSQYTAEKAAKLAAVLAATDAATIAENRRPIQAALRAAANLGCPRIEFQMARLLGITFTEEMDAPDRYWALTNRLRGNDKRQNQSQSGGAIVSPAHPATKEFSPEAAIAEAKRIIAGATDEEVDEIDWTREPLSDRERALRAAIIRRIEGQAMGDDEFRNFRAMSIYRELCELLDTTFGRIMGCGAASDLAEAIARSKARWDDANETDSREGRRKLLDLARRDVDGSGDELAADEDLESDDEIED
ncbi:MAG: hypothetical protein WBE59_10350 [Candidatus Cybelea sp.]